MRICRSFSRSRHRWVVLLAFLALSGAVAAHHELPAHVHGDDDVLTCLATVVVGIAFVAATAFAIGAPPVLLTGLPPEPVTAFRSSLGIPRARASPLLLRVVLRR
ncbi:MAG TPA: hypothetical protein VGI67_08160 [Thermoleophilaceae bacterium]|jgi:hypothetical protein